ncbi:MAG: ribonuclease Z [Bacteroidota bacterium]
MSFEITILGSNSAVSVYGRHQTAQHIKVQNHQFLFDCGEGTQLQLQRYGLKAQRLEAIFITHLHGDHYLGLVGLLSTLHLQGRTKPLDLYGPPQLSEIITTHIKYSDTTFRYMLHFHPLNMDEKEVVYENKQFTITSVPVQHRIPCVGFLVNEKEHPIRLNKKKLPLNIKIAEIATIKKGEDVLNDDGTVKYAYNELSMGRRRSRSYAYLTDTIYLPELAETIKGFDLLYHEATFLTTKELEASQTYHASAPQAAQFAKDAEVGKLLLGHFSARYKDLAPFEEEARKIFSDSHIANEGKTYSIEH